MTTQMNTLIVCTALLILGTKALDCLTTLRAVLVPEAESNPIARSMMNRLGVRRTTALVFVIATIWTCALTAVALATESVLVGAVFVAAGLFVALVQGAVAHSNWSGRRNGITRHVFRFHGTLGRLAPRLRRKSAHR